VRALDDCIELIRESTGKEVHLAGCSQGGMVAYTASKSGVAGLSRSLARDLGPFNIRVNMLLPGWIMTERQVKLWLTPEGEQKIMDSQCLKRKLYPADIAKVALFLASDESGACTNQEFIADGGWY
jgi:NAD(P)-dependent dehydrogenase (short-subunit alcohol dehydrogenase family)